MTDFEYLLLQRSLSELQQSGISEEHIVRFIRTEARRLNVPVWEIRDFLTAHGLQSED